MAPQLALHLLGTPQLYLDNKPVVADRRKALALLAYLAMNDGKSSRETLSALLWPDYTQSKAFTNLRHTLWEVQQAIGEGWIMADRESIQLAGGNIWLDVDQFESLLAQSQEQSDPSLRIPILVEAVKLYRNHFMSGFSLTDAPTFTDWAFAESEDLKQKLAGALTLLVESYLTLNQAESAIPHARRLIILDPLNESGHRQLMHVYVQAGQHSAALKQYQTCEQILRKELGVDPQPETRALYRQIRKGEIKPVQVEHQKKTNEPRHNIPLQLSTFIGREKEITEVKQELKEHRLVTLTGSGGTGKTRLSLQVAEDLLDHFEQGVWLVELAPLADPELIPQTILSALGLNEQQGKTALKTLQEFLHDKRLLILVDNCEHLIEASAKVVYALLGDAPHIKILASSREALGVKGELAYHVPSLSLPDPKHLPLLEQLSQYEAVRLFIDRASLVSPHFDVNRENAPAIAQICYRLDGIPLAIELAAARLKMLSADQIAARLDDRFRLLTGGARTALPRQQTLRATIDWSYDLLSENERLLLRRLAVFAGDWTLELAEQICADEKILQDGILDMLAHLVDKSLVAVDEDKTGTRYRILETVRQYAREKLFESGEGTPMRDKHRDEFLAFVEKVEPELIQGQQKKCMDVLEAEHDNLRAALSWSIENANAEQALRFCQALSFFWDRRKHFIEAALACKEALACAKQNDSLKMTTWYAFVLTASALFINVTKLTPWSDPSIRMLLEQAQEIYTTINDCTSTGPVWASCFLNLAYLELNDLSSAEKCVSNLYEKVKAAAYPWGIAQAKWSMADLSERKGDVVSALVLWQESSELFMQIEDVWAAKQVSGILLWHKVMRGELEDGIRLANQNLLFYEEYGDPGGIAFCFITLGTIARDQGQYESARRYFTHAINLGAETGDLGQVAFAGERDAHVLFYEGRLEEARAKYQDVLTRLKDVPNDFLYGFVHGRAALVSLHQNRLGDARKELAIGLEVLQKADPVAGIYIAYYGLGELARLEARYSEAIEFYQASLKALDRGHLYIGFPDILDGLAKTKLMQSKLEDAARLFGASEGLLKKMSMVIQTVDRPDYDKHIQLLREKMDPNELESAWELGRQMSREEVITYALKEL